MVLMILIAFFHPMHIDTLINILASIQKKPPSKPPPIEKR